MNRETAGRLAQGLLGKQMIPDLEMDGTGRILEIRDMMKDLVELTDDDFGLYAWSREPLERKFDLEQKRNYIREAEKCGRREAEFLKERYKSVEPWVIAGEMGFKVSMPRIPTGGGHVIFAQFVEPDEITIFLDSAEKAEILIKENSMGKLLQNVDAAGLLLAHEIFHGLECRKEDSIYTKTEKVELWKKPFSNRSRLVCLSEIAGMAFAKELLGISFSPYVFDVLLMYGYHAEAATALYEEIMEIAGAAEERTEVTYAHE